MSKMKIFLSITVICVAICTILELSNKQEVVEANSTSSFTLNVKDENLVPVQGIAFEVYQDNVLIDTIVSNSKGIATSKSLQAGKYQYKMSSCNNYYILDSEVKDLNLNGNDIITDFKVRKANYTFQITAVDENNNPIENINYEIYSNNQLVAKISSNNEGIALLDGLSPGGYTYKITSGPNNIILDKFIKTFSITEDNVAINLIFIKYYN